MCIRDRHQGVGDRRPGAPSTGLWPLRHSPRSSVRRCLAVGQTCPVGVVTVAADPTLDPLEARHLRRPRLAARHSSRHRPRVETDPRHGALVCRPRTHSPRERRGAHRLRHGAAGLTHRAGGHSPTSCRTTESASSRPRKVSRIFLSRNAVRASIRPSAMSPGTVPYTHLTPPTSDLV